MKKISQSTIEQLKTITPDELVAHDIINEAPNHSGKRGFACPLCGSGTGQNHNGGGDGAGEFDDDNNFFCHACGNEDVGRHKLSPIDLFAISRNLTNENFAEQCRQMACEFGVAVDWEEINFFGHSLPRSSRKITIKPPVVDEKKLELIRKDLYETSDSNLKTFVEKKCGGLWRGFDADFLISQKCKYIERWTTVTSRLEGKYCTPTPRILVPAGADNYLARFVGNLDIYDESTRKFIEGNLKLHAGTKKLFNVNALKSGKPIFCVEGYIDAMSIELANFNAVALGAVSRGDLLVDAVKPLGKKPQVIILLDSDKQGRKHAPKLYDALIKIGVPCCVRFLSEDESKIDCNDILTSQGVDNLRGILEKIYDDSLAELSAVEEEIAASNVVALPDDDRELQPKSKQRDADIIAAIRDRCTWNYKKGKDGRSIKTTMKATFANINFIFDHDPNLNGLFGFDKFQGENIFLKKAIWHDGDKTGETWSDSDDAQLRNYLRENYGELKERQLIEDYVIHYAHKNSFDAVKRFYETLPRWDGISRAETLFAKFLGAEDNDYTREVTMKWLLGAVARVYHPGCDFQWAPVLQGAQRIGKSKLVKMLGGKEGVNPDGYSWHVALKDSVDDAHAVDAIQKGGIIEIEEFSAARRAEINALKSFISADEDTRRIAYDRRATTRKRHGVFVVTCNDQEFLKDPTGNARFWIVKCTQKKFNRVDGMTPEYIRQVWAEVYQKYQELFKDGFDESKLKPSLELELRAEEIAENYVQDDGLKTEIVSGLDKLLPPDIIWKLMGKDERRKFIAEGRLVMVDALAEFNHRRRARGGNSDTVQRDVDLITSCLTPSQKKAWLWVERKKIFGNEVDEYTIYGSALREHICAAEIYNEFFGSGDKRKLIHRINEILTTLDGWHLGERKTLRNADPEYREQKKPYFRGEE